MANNKLDLLYKLESEKEESLRVNYMQAQHHLNDNQQKLSGLNDFRLEYAQQLHIKAKQGLTSGGFTQYHAFIKKIEEAILQQASTVNTAKQVVEQRKTLWLAQQVKAKAIAKLIEKKQVAHQTRINKAEQKMLDEFATNQFMRRRA
ncbi:flagellar export protein FliJ [Pseudoalteromonas holothuriae]|nr:MULTISPECIES: flagellar export protein FliJ [unclassified Pseudoalteromonas]